VRVFLDTNVLVSALATRGICADLLRTVLTEHQLLTSKTVLRELRRVLQGKFGVPTDTLEETEAFLRRHGEVVPAGPSLGLELRDPDDVPILEKAAAANTDVLVTGDRDLLEIAADAPLAILDPRGFWEFLRERATEDGTVQEK